VQLAEALDQLIVETGEVGGLEVGVNALLPQRIDQGLHGGVRDRA
jgi:hypothetical protein